MARLFRARSCSLNSMPPPVTNGDEDAEDDDNSDEDENPATTPFISPPHNPKIISVLAVVAAAFRRSLVTCSVDAASDVDIGWPTDVRHVSHVTFDRFNGFLGLPLDLQPHVPPKPPSARFHFLPFFPTN